MRKMESSSFEVLDSHKRMEEREKWRRINYEIERELLRDRRKRRSRESIDDRVAKAVVKLRGAKVPQAISLIESLSTTERDVYLLAEEVGANRKSVLQQFPPVRKSTRLAYYGETPNESPEPPADGYMEAETSEATVGQPVDAQSQTVGESPS